MGAEHQVAPSPWTVESIARADLARRLTLRDQARRATRMPRVARQAQTPLGASALAERHTGPGTRCWEIWHT